MRSVADNRAEVPLRGGHRSDPQGDGAGDVQHDQGGESTFD